MKERRGIVIINKKEEKVTIVDNGENLGEKPSSTPNHDKVEIVYSKGKDQK
ncbi:MAG: hypothetical protein KatS3mg088_281 [Patescibacteria group bacterium]|nr:MAG: hypothetical protein KatS3mg088_281 [Patescibacteria group bacterium]